MLLDCDWGWSSTWGRLPNQPNGGQPLQGHKPGGNRSKNQFHFDMGKELYRVLGTDLTVVPGLSALTVITLVTEIGTDWGRFSNVAAFRRWLTLCASCKREWGQGSLSRKTHMGNSRLAAALRLAAQTLHKSHSYLGAYYPPHAGTPGRAASHHRCGP